MRFDLANKEQEIIVYFDSWDKFAAAVEQLCIAEPNIKFRFVIKYPHWKCRKYRTKRQQDTRETEHCFNEAWSQDTRETEHCFNEACSRQKTVNIPFLLIIAHKSQRSNSKFV